MEHGERPGRMELLSRKTFIQFSCKRLKRMALFA
jgi:hypothetical protein